MKATLPILLLLTALLHGKEPPLTQEKSPISLLPNGSVLKGVLLPRYDKNLRLSGDLKIQTMTLIDGGTVQGENVLIRFYNPDRTPSGKIELTHALFNQKKSTLTATQPIKLTRDRLTATASGLIYSFDSGQGFLTPPVTTQLSPPPATTSMTTTPRSLAAATALLSLSPATLIAAPPAYVTSSELTEIQTTATSQQATLQTAAQTTATQLATSLEASTTATAAAATFIEKNGIKPPTPEAPPAPPAPPAPLATTPSPDDTLISCDGGMFFDADTGVLVYLKNVRITDPRFTLDGADELKIFFEKKPPTTPANPKAPSGPSANFTAVKKLIATGTVKITQKSVNGKDPVEASGGLLTYDIQSGEIIVSQRYPWVKQGSYFARAKQPNLTLRLLTTGAFSTQGAWEMGANLNLKAR